MYEAMLFVIAVVGTAIGARLYDWVTRPKRLRFREASARICAYAQKILPSDYRYMIKVTRTLDVSCTACFGEGCPICRKQPVADATRQLPPRPPAPRGSKG